MSGIKIVILLFSCIGAADYLADFNAFVISSMMGCVISFTIPFSLGVVRKDQHSDLFFGFLCGIATIPVGGLTAGLICGIPFVSLLMNLIPLIVLSVISK